MSSDTLRPHSGPDRIRTSPGDKAGIRVSSAHLHDLGNLIQALLASAEDALCSEVPAEVLRSALVRTRTASQRASELLLHMQAPKEGRSVAPSSAPPAREPPPLLAIAPLVAEACDLARASMPRSVRLVEDLGGARIEARLDALALHCVVLNLLRNAAEALGRAEGTIRVVLSPAGRTGPEGAKGFLLAIEDDGPGMDADTLAAACEPGFSMRGALRGFGLSSAAAFAAAHGGRLDLESSPGQGTCVRLLLPADEDTQRAE